MKSQHIYYQLTVDLARAQRADLVDDTADEIARLTFIKSEVEDMLARLVLRGTFDVASVISPVADRPEGWLTVLEWLAENDFERLMELDDLLVETSRIGIKCSRMCKLLSVMPHSVPAPTCFAEEADHFVTVYCYPPAVIDDVVNTM
jgi:hypothetical protein